MSSRKRSLLQGDYGSSGTQFPDNSTGLITPIIERTFGQDITDSHFNLTDDQYTGAKGLYLNITDTTGLKALVTVGVSVNIIIFFASSGLALSSYKLISGTDVESLPNVVRPNDYDGTTNQKVWKLISTIALNSVDTFFNFSEDFILYPLATLTSTGSGGGTISTSGQGVDNISHAMGVMDLSTASGSASLCALSSLYPVTFGFGFTLMNVQRTLLTTLSNGSDTYKARVGFMDSTSSTVNNGAYFRYTNAVNGGKWQAVTVSGGTETATDTGIAADTNWHIFKIITDPDATNVKFYIDGTLVATNSTNIINSSSNTCSSIIAMEKTLGTNARHFYIDYMQLQTSRTSAR